MATHIYIFMQTLKKPDLLIKLEVEFVENKKDRFASIYVFITRILQRGVEVLKLKTATHI